MNSYSYEKRKKLAIKTAGGTPIGIPMTCFRICPAACMKLLSIRKFRKCMNVWYEKMKSCLEVWPGFGRCDVHVA